MSNTLPINLSVGRSSQPFFQGPNAPIVAKRAPTGTDRAPIGTLWIQSITTANVAVNGAWVLTSIIANVANWADISGGGAIFTSLTVNGPTMLNGALTVNSGVNAIQIGTDAVAKAITIGNATGATSVGITVGTGGFTLNGVATSNYAIGASTTTGNINIGGTGNNTGQFNLAPGTGNQTILIAGSGAGTKQISLGGSTGVNTVVIGNLVAGSSSTIEGGTLGISLTSTAPVAGAGGILVTQGAVPFRILCGAGAPNNNLAIEAGDLYIRSDPADATSRLYIATAANMWTNITCAA